jgi:SanA protein
MQLFKLSLKKIYQWITKISLLIICFISFSIIWMNWTAIKASNHKTFSNYSFIDDHRVGLVFGCDDKIGERENLYFTYRIDAAVELWNTGKLQCLIVSGDNRKKNYNEPEKMKAALIARGVPKEKIVCDFAGLRTLDSVVRAKEVFDVKHIVFITQKFQNERAIYIAQANGIDAIGFNAKDVSGVASRKTKIREIGARCKMWLDVNILNTKPAHLGEKEILPD